MNVKVTLRNPVDKQDTVSYTIVVAENAIAQRWYDALNGILIQNKYLEKNFCFLGFPNSQRNLEYICRELQWAKNEINKFFAGRYIIEENYTPLDLCPDNINPNQDAMNKLHNHFEHLQGTVWGLSDWYKEADYTTKFAIRQLNNLCHEAESLMLSQRKKIQAPEWIRPSQITTFLNAHRYEFPAEHKKTFHESNYDRQFGHVYLHWSQIGKTLFEVYNDEDGADINQAMCDAVTHLRYYSGEFDVEWARDVTYGGQQPWHSKRMSGFRAWLNKNNFNINDNEYNYGYHEVGKIDLLGSFGTEEPEEVWDILSNHLDIVRIETVEASAEYNYTWTDPDYYDQQINRLKPGYDYSSGR